LYPSVRALVPMAIIARPTSGRADWGPVGIRNLRAFETATYGQVEVRTSLFGVWSCRCNRRHDHSGVLIVEMPFACKSPDSAPWDLAYQSQLSRGMGRVPRDCQLERTPCLTGLAKPTVRDGAESRRGRKRTTKRRLAKNDMETAFPSDARIGPIQGSPKYLHPGRRVRPARFAASVFARRSWRTGRMPGFQTVTAEFCVLRVLSACIMFRVDQVFRRLPAIVSSITVAACFCGDNLGAIMARESGL